jgi:hypothetical protein
MRARTSVVSFVEKIKQNRQLFLSFPVRQKKTSDNANYAEKA